MTPPVISTAGRNLFLLRCQVSPAMTRKKNPKPVGLGIKDLIVAMDQGGVKHCQRGTLKQRGHSKKIAPPCLWQLFSA
jgi:hypothetical protein